MNARIALALGASLALHAAALTYVAYKGLETARGLPASELAQGPVMLARLMIDDRPPVLPVIGSAAVPTSALPPLNEKPAAVLGSAPVPAKPASSPARAFAGDEALAGFVPATQLSVKPVAISVGELEPDWLTELKGAAVATVSVYVAADGSVFHVEVRKASDSRIAELARKAFSQARFKPGMMQGQNVASRVDISLDYEDPRDRVAHPDAPRPGERVLGQGDNRKAIDLVPDKPVQNRAVEK